MALNTLHLELTRAYAVVYCSPYFNGQLLRNTIAPGLGHAS